MIVELLNGVKTDLERIQCPICGEILKIDQTTHISLSNNESSQLVTSHTRNSGGRALTDTTYIVNKYLDYNVKLICSSNCISNMELEIRDILSTTQYEERY